MDNFGVKYAGKKQAEQFIAFIQKYYTVSVDWTGELYCGVILDLDHKKKYVTLSMPGYVEGTMH